MRVRVLLVISAAAALAGAPALAQNVAYGSSVRKAPAWPALPGAPKPAPAPRPPSPPPTPTFKPYEPYRASSVYSAPKPATGGAKDCELSVYVNACGKRAR